MKRLLGLLLAFLIATPALAQSSGGDSTFTNPVAIGGQNYTFPASTATLAGLGTTQAWTGANTYSNAAPITYTSAATGGQVWCNTADCTTNYERERTYWTGNIYTETIEKGGTGATRGYQWLTADGQLMTFTGGVLGGLSNIQIYANGQIGWNTRGGFLQPSDGVFQVWNAAQNNFTRFNLGGGTSSFPAIGRSAAAISLVQADGTVVTYASCTALTTNSSGVIGCTASDPRLKTDMRRFTPGLKAVQRVVAASGPITFRGKPNNPEHVDTRQRAGFNCAVIAKYIPHGSHVDKLGYCNLDPEALIGTLFNAVAELQVEITARKR